MQPIQSSYSFVVDCIQIINQEFKERIASTNYRSDVEKNLTSTMLIDAQSNIQNNITKQLDEKSILTHGKSGYKCVKACLKIINNQFKELRKLMTEKTPEEQNIIGNLLTSTEIELEKKIKQILSKTIMHLQFVAFLNEEAYSIQGFFTELLLTLKNNGEKFEIKYPDIISGFDGGLISCLIRNEVIKGSIYDNGRIEDVELESARSFLIVNIVNVVLGKTIDLKSLIANEPLDAHKIITQWNKITSQAQTLS